MDEGEVARLLQVGRLSAFRGRPAVGVGPLGRVLRAVDPTSTAAGEGRWLAAVGAAALGRYGVALAHLDALPRESVWAALGAATRGAVYRQLGRHAQGEAADLAALRAADTLTGGGGSRKGAGPTGAAGPGGTRVAVGGAPEALGGGGIRALWADARADAVIGLVADAVGQGQVGTATARLARAAAAAQRGHDSRHTIRMGWVRAEVALLTGDPHRAVVHATAALAAAGRAGYPRHATKSLLFLGVATIEIGDPRGLDLLREAAVTATGLGLLPLAWPAHAVLADRLSGAGRAAESTVHHQAARQAVREIGEALPDGLKAGWYAAPDRAGLR